MKIPERTPQTKLSPDFVADLPGMAAKVGDVLRRAQSDYLYWDKFKHLRMPAGVRAADAWALVKLMRNLNRRPTAVPSADGGRFTYSLTVNIRPTRA